jgi:hypothetical protein
MKRLSKVILFLCFYTHFAYSDDHDKIANITQDIACISQKIANDYLHMYYDKENKILKLKLKNSIDELEKNFRELAKDSDDLNTKNILDFLSYSKDEMKNMIDLDISKENVSQMLDYSKTLLEGTESVLKSHDYNISKNKKSKLELLKLSTLYMKLNLKFDATDCNKMIEQKIQTIDQELKNNPSWDTYKKLIQTKGVFIPNIISILTQNLEENI